MLGMTDVHDLPLRRAVDHYLVTLRVEGAAPMTIETYRSVLASYLRWSTTDMAPTLADFTLLPVPGYVAHLMGEHMRVAHHHDVRAGGWLSDYTINLHGRVLRAFAAWLAREAYTEQHVVARQGQPTPAGEVAYRRHGGACATGRAAVGHREPAAGDRGGRGPGVPHPRRSADYAQHGALVREAPRAAGRRRTGTSAPVPALDGRGVSIQRRIGERAPADLGHVTREIVEHYMHLADTVVTQLHRRHSPLDYF